MIRQDHLGFVSGPGQTVEFVSLSETQNTTLQLQLWTTKMRILHLDPDCNPRTNPQPARTTQHGNVRSRDVSRGFMREIPGVYKAPDDSGRFILRAANDNADPEHSFIRSLLKRMIVGLYCWHLLSGSVAQRAIDRLRVWEA